MQYNVIEQLCCVCIGMWSLVIRAGANGPASQVLAWPLFTRCMPSFSNCLGLAFVTKALERNAVVINTIFERKFSSQCFICFVLLKMLISKCNLLGMAMVMARQPSLAWPDRFFRFSLEWQKPQRKMEKVVWPRETTTSPLCIESPELQWKLHSVMLIKSWLSCLYGKGFWIFLFHRIRKLASYSLL